MKLTRDAVVALTQPKGKSDHFVWDDDMPGFGVRMRGDRKRWIVQYRVGGRQRRESLGDTRRIKINAARAIAGQSAHTSATQLMRMQVTVIMP